MSRVLVAEKIADAGLDALRDAGHDVDVQTGLSPEALRVAVVGAAGLIVRSATQVDAELLAAAGGSLVVVGRAGVGLDNVDTVSATEHGVMVVNAPESNITSAAEHTMALLLSQARNVPQAHAALVDGRWERSQWEGVELQDKTLGIVGFGRIGTLVAQRAAAFGMKIVAYDPFVGPEAGKRLDAELVDLDELMRRADFVTLHVAKTPDTVGLINKERLALAKPTLRIINVARGGIIDEPALADAVRSGQVAGAAIDVFEQEPTTDSPLIGVPGIVVTPHLGASTAEAQDRAGETIADQVIKALAGDFVPFAVNVDAGAATGPLRDHLPVCEQLGAMFADLVDQLPESIDLEFRGDIGESDPSLGTLSFLKGLLGKISGSPVSYVNASSMAAERGLEVRVIAVPSSRERANAIRVSGGDHSLAGALSPLDGGPRLLEVDGHRLEIRPSDHMLIVRNADVPGMVGIVGTEVGDAGVNISNMYIGEDDDGVAAMMVISTDGLVPNNVQATLRSVDGVQEVRAIRLR
ncbi:MAG: phosphoglycerate dehydrogenase [Actinomycetota bacterium]